MTDTEHLRTKPVGDTMKRLILALAILALALPALAHDPVSDLAEKVGNLKARQDVLTSRLDGVSGAIDDLYELADALKARADVSDASHQSHAAAIDDLYRYIDAIRDAMQLPDEPEE